MKKRFLICAAAVLCLYLLICTATADSITLNGKTIPAETIQISAPVSGTAEKVSVEAGQKIQAEDTLYTMKTTKIYADRDGTVAGVFGQPGDDAETVGTRYGAILYLEESPAYTVSASTSNAYNSLEAKHVHTGETVFVVSRTNTARTGKGIVTAVSGTSYTVEITEGVFLSGESVELFRNEEYDYDQKIGRGTISRTDPTAVTAAGAIVKIAVKNGDEVKRGDLLLETLDGTYDAYTMEGTEIKAGLTGVVGSISVEAGSMVEKGNTVAEIYPMDRMRVEANIPEDYCNQVKEGDSVTIELVTDMSKTYTGTVVMISSVATEGDEEVTYRIVAEFVPDESVRFGMSALITAGEEEIPETKEEISEPNETHEEEKTETEESGNGRRRERPEGMPEWNGEGERPEMPEGGSWGGKAEDAPDASGEAADGEAGETQEGSNP